MYDICTKPGRNEPHFPAMFRKNGSRGKNGFQKFPMFQGHLWWARQGLNLRPHPCEGCALPLSYAPACVRLCRRQARAFTRGGAVLQASQSANRLANRAIQPLMLAFCCAEGRAFVGHARQ